MQIACPQCSMQYALDPRLLPPGGVPVQCTRCSHVFIAAPPARATTQTTQVFGTPPRPAANPNPNPNSNPNPNPNSTLLYGAGKTGTQPSTMTTQAFGAVPQVPPVAPVAPVGNKPQPAPAGKPPATMTTQAFGAVPQVPPVAPAGNKPPPAAHKTPAGAAPSRTATQAFGVVPQPSTAQSQVRGSERPEPPAGPSPQPARPPSAATPPFGSTPQGAPVARVPAAPEPRVSVAATTPIELPEEILVQLNRPLSDLLAEETSPEDRPSPGASPVPGLSKPLELPPELLNEAVESVKGAGGRGKRPETGRKGRLLLIAGGVLVLALTAFLTSPAWLSKSNAVPHGARVAREEAVALLRRDDSASKEEALSRLKALSAAHPESVELLAEVGIALAMHLDDTQVRVTTLREKEKRLQARISRLSVAQTPADWQSRVNMMRDELAATQRALTPLQERAAVLSKEAVQTLKRLDAVPEKETREAALARLRGRALLNGALGGGEALGMAVQLAQAELRDWSTLTMAEYVLNHATPSETQVKEAASALEHMREADKTFLRTYVLGARIALMREEPAAAQGLLDTVITLNPKHELAQQLHVYAGEWVNQEPEPKTTPAPEANPTP